MKPLFRLCLLGLAVTLSACQVMGPNYHLPEKAAVNRADLQGDLKGNNPDVVSAPVPGNWWQLYNDPRLNRLVQQALSANSDLRVAAANITRAQNQLEYAQSQGGFSTSVSGEAQRLQESGQAFLLTEKVPVSNIGAFSIKTSYQFDMWGVFQRGVEAANANAEAAQAAADLARITVVGNVVKAYTQVCAANEEHDIALKSLSLQQEGVTLAQRLRDAGRGDETQVTRTQTQFKSLRAELPKYEAERQAGLNTLAMLLAIPGNQLPAGTGDCAELPHMAQLLPVGDGTALFKRRPDVRQAERKLASATARIGVATAELYPDIRLGASLGAAGLLEDFGQPMTQQWSIGPLISWTLPSSGTHARIHAAEAGADAALAEFDHAVLQALRETQTALDRYAQDLRRLQSLREAQQQAALAAEQNRRLYQAGRTPYLSSLDADRSLVTSDATLAAAEAQVSRDQIHLFLVLGGGWQTTVAAAAPATAQATAK